MGTEQEHDFGSRNLYISIYSYSCSLKTSSRVLIWDKILLQMAGGTPHVR